MEKQLLDVTIAVIHNELNTGSWRRKNEHDNEY